MRLKKKNQNGLNETKKAIAELEAGLGIRFSTVEELMNDLRGELISEFQIDPPKPSISHSSLKRHKN